MLLSQFVFVSSCRCQRLGVPHLRTRRPLADRRAARSAGPPPQQKHPAVSRGVARTRTLGSEHLKGSEAGRLRPGRRRAAGCFCSFQSWDKLWRLSESSRDISKVACRRAAHSQHPAEQFACKNTGNNPPSLAEGAHVSSN